MTLLCYGDSNTFGYDPRSYFGSRYDPAFRWVDILAAKTGWQVHNNSMNGREIPGREVPIPKSTDLLILMLGTNDLLQGASPQEAAGRMEHFLDSLAIDRAKILLIAPPPMKRGEWVPDDSLIRSSAELALEYASLAAKLGIHFANAGEWDVEIAFDGVHFTEAGHISFAAGLLEYMKKHL